jgi:NADP-dependent 3-hydroxy acid dehydrogenase YdfG
MKVLVFGGTGTVGTAVMNELKHHELISVGKSRGDLQADIASDESVTAVFAKVGHVDAIVSVTGDLHFGTIEGTTAEQFNIGLQSKLLGQVRLALIGQNYLHDGGSITLTSGILSHEPIKMGSNATTVNAAVDAFVLAAAIELPRSLRINAVSPSVVTESLGAYGPFFPGFESVSAARVALAVRRSVEGAQTGRAYRVW